MAIAARSGVSGAAISKVGAAYSLGATKFEVMRRAIIPNLLRELFTGARVAQSRVTPQARQRGSGGRS